jgi:colanic acid/amylovoran biosynthesis protein
VIVDELRLNEKDGRAERVARVRWASGDFLLSISTPAEFCSGREDASPFLCATLLLAMRVGEDLDLRGPVAAPLLARASRIVELYAQWDPRLHRTRVRAERTLRIAGSAAGIGCFFSRGVDSTYSAATPRGLPGAVTHLVHCDRLEPLHSPSMRAEEIRLAGEAAHRLGLPLVVIDTNLRELSDPIVQDWADMAGAGLSFLATSMAGVLGHVLIPSSDGENSLLPSGSSPLLDPLFSSAEVRVEHDSPKTRPAKVAWLARERPDLLRYIKVCYHENRPDNCGRCSKCVLTMLSLEATGLLGEATGFPHEIDPDVIAAVRIRGLQAEEEFREVEQALRAREGNAELAALVAEALERGAALPAETELPDDTPAFRRRSERQLRVSDEAQARRDGARSRPRDEPAAPRVTVMVPSYESEATLPEAVASVLGQTTGELELVVVDDGSSIPVAEVLADVRDARLRILRHGRNRGLSAARNTALAAARAPLVSQLDADDLWELDYLAAVLPCFDDPAVGLAYTNCTIVGHPDGHEDYIGDPSVHPMHAFPKIAEQNPVPSPTATMRAAAVRAVGGYARWLHQCEDYHLYLKLAHAGWRFAYVDRRLARYRWPEPGRGMSHDARRHELWEHAMFGSFVARHPRTPGPRRQVRVRARREAQNLRAVAPRRLPPLDSARPRLLVEPGSHAMLNLGDVAMLQVCVRRLRALWPGAAIGVVTTAPELLARHCPGVIPVPASGQYQWFEQQPSGVGGRWPRIARRASAAGSRPAALAVRAALARAPAGDDVRTFVSWLLGADGVVVSGRGGFTDAFLEDGLQVLELLRTATALGIPSALFGQGIGPVEDHTLRERAREVLPRMDLIAVRERRTSLPLLDGLGVPPNHVRVTGDDALELAHGLRSNGAPRKAIGIGLRVAPYSGVTDDAVRAVGPVLRDLAARRQAELRPVTISLYPHEADDRTLRRVLDRHPPAAATPSEAVRQAGGCRVVVAGSYHAAVFALGQGVPVVALTGTPYYRAKLEGLAELFPGGCRVLSLGDADLLGRLRDAVDEAWEDADERRPALLEAAERQIAEARRAYAGFEQPVARRTAVRPGLGST